MFGTQFNLHRLISLLHFCTSLIKKYDSMTSSSSFRTMPLFIALLVATPSFSATSFDDPLTNMNDQLWWLADGWSNGFPFINRWESEAISFSTNGMAITLSNTPDSTDPQNLTFQSGELRSNDFYSYGCFEAEIKPAAADGVITSFFLFAGPYDRTETSNGKHNEIDIEFLGNNTDLLQINYWTNDDNYTSDHARIIFLDFDASEDFHRYGIKWTKHAIQWFIDGKLVFKVKNTSSDPIPKSTDSPLRIMANIWATDSEISGWAGEFDQNSVPITAEYRNIRYIKGGRCNLKG